AEFLRALTAGATVCPASPEVLLPGPTMMNWLREQGITLMALPPSLLAMLPAEEELPALRSLVIAGEACPAELADRWRRPGRKLFNAYGPTEATVCSTLAPDWLPGRTPPFGRPLANTHVHVL